ncbi:MAG TPA: class I SAM-dependent methyltransferase family protein [Candidatus Bathyarchaeota archaeon]|nr:class I SAM-dependent methyltransferase family protein [Candidatus Bathyarchaeota archaeon]
MLAEVLPEHVLSDVYNSYDIVGDIAIIRLTRETLQFGEKIAETIMKIHRNVQTVLAQTSPVHGDFRTRKLEHVAGENKTVTLHKESGCLFSVDVEKCYFSPRLSFERMRVAKQVRDGEVIVNMFAGVGCFSIVIAKNSNAEKIYSIDINPAAVEYMKENVRLNRVYGRVIPILGDAKEIILQRLSGKAERVLMPLPEKAYEYLPYAISAFKNQRGVVHYYNFEHAKKGEDPVEKVKLKVIKKLEELNVGYKFLFGRVVRTTGPNWHQVVLDIKING